MEIPCGATIVLALRHEGKTNFTLPFQDRLIPVEVRSLGEVLPVQIQTLTEAQQLAQLFDQFAPAHAWFPGPL